MTFYIYSNGDLADADQVNANFNETIYAILYNRMEQDTNATYYNAYNACTNEFATLLYRQSQLNQDIQSDVFWEFSLAALCRASNGTLVCVNTLVGNTQGISGGKYATVCAADTTSMFCTNSYTNVVGYNVELDMDSNFCLVCTSCTGPVSFCCVATPTLSRIQISGCNYVGCLSSTRNICSNLDLSEYNCVKMVINNNSFGYAYGCCTIYCRRHSFNGDLETVNLCAAGFSGQCWCDYNSFTYELIRDPTTNNFNIYKNTVCTGNQDISCLVNFCLYNRIYHQAIGYNVTSFGCISHILTGYKFEASKVQTNIKEYATPKNLVVLSTISTLPAGNCIRYNIKDQAGTVLLCDASPDAVYNLSSPANCLYAEIYQCIECNLCTPQCMTQYALMYM